MHKGDLSRRDPGLSRGVTGRHEHQPFWIVIHSYTLLPNFVDTVVACLLFFFVAPFSV